MLPYRIVCTWKCLKSIVSVKNALELYLFLSCFSKWNCCDCNSSRFVTKLSNTLQYLFPVFFLIFSKDQLHNNIRPHACEGKSKYWICVGVWSPIEVQTISQSLSTSPTAGSRLLLGLCQLLLKNGGNSCQSCVPIIHYKSSRIQCKWRTCDLYLDNTTHSPFLHWQSCCHQATTVKQSSWSFGRGT